MKIKFTQFKLKRYEQEDTTTHKIILNKESKSKSKKSDSLNVIREEENESDDDDDRNEG